MSGVAPKILTISTNEYNYLQDIPRYQLSLEDEQRYVDLARAGNQEARQFLMLNYLQYVASIARKFNPRPWLDFLDYVQIGNLAMVERFDEMLQEHDPEKGKMKAFLGTVIQHDIIDCLRGWKSLAEDIDSLEEPRDGQDTMALRHMLPDTRGKRQERDYQPLYQALERLRRSQREVLIRHYGLYEHAPQRLAEIDKAMGWERNVAYKRRKRALKKLHEVLMESAP